MYRIEFRYVHDVDIWHSYTQLFVTREGAEEARLKLERHLAEREPVLAVLRVAQTKNPLESITVDLSDGQPLILFDRRPYTWGYRATPHQVLRLARVVRALDRHSVQGGWGNFYVLPDFDGLGWKVLFYPEERDIEQTLSWFERDRQSNT